MKVYINRKGERPRYHLSDCLVRVCESYAEERVMNRMKRRRSLSKQQSREETRCLGCGGTVGDVIGFRRGVLLIPGRTTRKSQPANSSRGCGAEASAGRGGFLLPIFRLRGLSLPSGAYIYNEK